MRKFNLKTEILTQFLNQNNVENFILGENFHSEIFKRSISLMKFLFENGSGVKLLEKIW